MRKLLANLVILAGISSVIGTTVSRGDPKIYKLDLSYQRIYHNSDPMVSDIPNRQWGDAVELETGVQAGRWYLDAMPHFESAYGKIMTAGLVFHTGFEITNWLDLEYSHHSRHSLDRPNDYADPYNSSPHGVTAYPLFDSYGVRIHFVPNQRGQR